MPVAHCRFWKFKLSNRTQVVPGPLVSINLYRGRQGPASSSCRPILSTNHGGLARRSAGASVARRAALRRARLPASAHVPRWQRWWPVRLLRCSCRRRPRIAAPHHQAGKEHPAGSIRRVCPCWQRCRTLPLARDLHVKLVVH
jgi:hypothetical protein